MSSEAGISFTARPSTRTIRSVGTDARFFGGPSRQEGGYDQRITDPLGLNAYSSELTPIEAPEFSHLRSRGIFGMGIELLYHAADRLLDQRRHIDRIDIHLTDIFVRPLQLGERPSLCRSGRETAISAVRNDDNPATASNSPKNHMLRFISNYMIAYFSVRRPPKQVPRNTGK